MVTERARASRRRSDMTVRLRHRWLFVLALVAGTGCGQTSFSEGPQLAPPGRLAGAVLAFDAGLGTVVAVGGPALSGRDALDLWSWDGHRWQPADVGGSPPARTSPLAAADPSTGGVLLVGGQTGGTSSTSCSPTPTTTPTGGRPAMCAGVAVPVHPLSDVWSLNGRAWKQVAPNGTVPQQGQLLAAAPSLSSVVLVGRTRALTAAATAGTWRWTGHHWALVTATTPEAAGSMAADPASGALLAYGGQAPFTPGPGMGAASTAGYSRTWQLTGSGWQELHPATVPDHAPGVMTDTPDGTRLLLISTTGLTWTWIGNAWQPYTTTSASGSAPSWSGVHLSAATNPRTGQVVLLAAVGISGDATWTLTGRRWQQQPGTP